MALNGPQVALLNVKAKLCSEAQGLYPPGALCRDKYSLTRPLRTAGLAKGHKSVLICKAIVRVGHVATQVFKAASAYVIEWDLNLGIFGELGLLARTVANNMAGW